MFRHCITPSPSSAEQPSSTKGTPAGASPAGVTTNPWGLSGRPARTSGRRPDGGQLADAGTLGPVTALTLAAALPGMGSRTAGGSTDPGSLCRRGGRLRPTCPCPCRVHPCRAWPCRAWHYWVCPGGLGRRCRRCHARCWVGPPAQCAGCWWTHRHRLDPRHQPSGMRWAGRSADGRPAPRHVPARGRDRRGRLGVLHGQAKNNPDEGPKQGAHDHQELTATAKRPLHRPSNIEHAFLAGPPRRPNLST